MNFKLINLCSISAKQCKLLKGPIPSIKIEIRPGGKE